MSELRSKLGTKMANIWFIFPFCWHFWELLPDWVFPFKKITNFGSFRSLDSFQKKYLVTFLISRKWSSAESQKRRDLCQKNALTRKESYDTFTGKSFGQLNIWSRRSRLSWRLWLPVRSDARWRVISGILQLFKKIIRQTFGIFSNFLVINQNYQKIKLEILVFLPFYASRCTKMMSNVNFEWFWSCHYFMVEVTNFSIERVYVVNQWKNLVSPNPWRHTGHVTIRVYTLFTQVSWNNSTFSMKKCKRLIKILMLSSFKNVTSYITMICYKTH